MTHGLMPLPDPAYPAIREGDMQTACWEVDCYTAEQMRAAIDAAVAEAYERCAGMAENYDLGTPEGHAIARCIRAAAPTPRPGAQKEKTPVAL